MTALRFGLPVDAVERICAVFARCPRLERAVLYGSRAKGNYRDGSDIDLTLHGDGLSHRDLLQILGELDDLLLPWTIDLSLFATLDHAGLREHIARVGVPFYERPQGR